MENSEQEELVDMADESMDEAGKLRRDKADCSHRVIEKRRRDRINNSLMQLSKLIPFDQFNKKNSGKLEKAEILEVTVQYLMMEQQQQQKQQQQKKETADVSCQHVDTCKNGQDKKKTESSDFLKGFKDCINNARKFFEEVEELDVSEGRCHRLIQHLRKQVSLYEKKDFVPLKDLQEDCKNTHTSKSLDQDIPVLAQSTTVVKVENPKRKNDKQAETWANKKSKTNTSVIPVGGEVQLSPEQETVSINEGTESAFADQPNNFMPYFLQNMPFFPTICTGATIFPNDMPQYQLPSPQTQFPGYPFLQSGTPYVPVALPQLPYIGLNFMSAFGMMNAGGLNQQQNNGLPGTNMANGFVPSMYTNGMHENLMAMRHHDSGYDSSDRSSSNGSRSQYSPQSCSDDSCSS